MWQWLGAQPLADGGVQFAVWAPNAKSVRVVGDWDGWVDGDALVEQDKSGVWAGVAQSAAVGYRYKFAIESANGNVDDEAADLMAYETECPPGIASVVAAEHRLGDDSWMSTCGHDLPHLLRIAMHSPRGGTGASDLELAHQIDHRMPFLTHARSCSRRRASSRWS